MSKRRVISQREARRTRKQFYELDFKLQQIFRRYSSQFPGTHIASNLPLSTEGKAIVDTAVRLGYGLAAKINGNTLDIYAVKP